MPDFDLDWDLQTLAEMIERWADSERFNRDDLITLRICVNSIQKERNQRKATLRQELLAKIRRMRNE